MTTALWDEPRRRQLLAATVAAARDTGSVQLLDAALWTLSNAELKGGTPRQSRHYMDQVRELRQAIGYDAEHVVNVGQLAWADVPRDQVEAIAAGAGAAGFAGVQVSGQAALAVRDLADGRYSDAFDGLLPLVEEPFLQVTPLEYADFVEAGVRSGRADQVTRYVERLESMAAANGSRWNRGVAARARALLGGADAEAHFRASVTHLEAASILVELARTHLLYGEWLRRARRRRAAGDHLRRAVELFRSTEAVAFERRARRELNAIGEQVEIERPVAGASFTVQEVTVARLAATGQTNAEIGATMFLSTNTVDYHLRKVFRKLGITSRRQLTEHVSRLS